MWGISRKLEHPCLCREARKTRSVPTGEVKESLQQRWSWKQGTWPLPASDQSRNDPGHQAPLPHSFAPSLQQVPPVGWVQAEGRGQESPNGIFRAEPSRHRGAWSGYAVDLEDEMVMELLCPVTWCKDFLHIYPLHICIFTHLHIQYWSRFLVWLILFSSYVVGVSAQRDASNIQRNFLCH